jgi:chaperonin GroEL
MKKELSIGRDARKGLLAGVNKLGQAVVGTLGPSGRTVLIEQATGEIISTKDGVSVAKAVDLQEALESVGANIVKQASIKTGDQAGDGTTTSTLLAMELFNGSMEYIRHLKHNNVLIKEGMEIAKDAVIKYLKDNLSQEITDESKLKQIATVSANNDEEIGNLIVEAMNKVGRDGLIAVEESNTGETVLETVEGLQFDSGYKSPFFVTDNKTMSGILIDPYILLLNKKSRNLKELLPLLENISSSQKSLLIVAEDIEGEVLSMLVVNKMNNILPSIAIKAPGFGDNRLNVLEDIAVLTGATVVSEQKGMDISKPDLNWLGTAKKAVVTKDSTVIIGAGGSSTNIEARALEIKAQIDNTKVPFEKEKLQDRLGRVIGGVALIKVGGYTEMEVREKKDRVDDALHATRAAVEEGIIAGGGSALLHASDYIIKTPIEESNPDKCIGIALVVSAIRKPFSQILRNAGFSDADIEKLEDDVLSQGGDHTGYNVRTAEIGDMIKQGIIDPTKVTRLALENAVSVAGTLLTTDAVICLNKSDNSPDENPENSIMHGQ